jgi:hypothetical protein
LKRHRCLSYPSDNFERRRKRSSDQASKAGNPAKKKPPSSIDQSPASNPKSRACAVKRGAVERNIADASMPFD